MKYKKIIAGVSAILMCAVSIPFATAFADDTASSAVAAVDESVSTYAAYKAGDANLDGKVTVADVVKTARYVVGSEKGDGYTVNEMNAAVVSGKDKVSGKALVKSEDVLAIAKHIIGNDAGKEFILKGVQPQATLKLPAGKSKIAIFVGKDKAGKEDVNGGYGYGEWSKDEQGEFSGTVDKNGYVSFEITLEKAQDNFQVQVYYVDSETSYTEKTVKDVKIGLAKDAEETTESSIETEATTETATSTESTTATESTTPTEATTATEATTPTEATTETESSETKLVLFEEKGSKYVSVPKSAEAGSVVKITCGALPGTDSETKVEKDFDYAGLYVHFSSADGKSNYWYDFENKKFVEQEKGLSKQFAIGKDGKYTIEFEVTKEMIGRDVDFGSWWGSNLDPETAVLTPAK